MRFCASVCALATGKLQTQVRLSHQSSQEHTPKSLSNQTRCRGAAHRSGWLARTCVLFVLSLYFSCWCCGECWLWGLCVLIKTQTALWFAGVTAPRLQPASRKRLLAFIWYKCAQGPIYGAITIIAETAAQAITD